MACLNPISILVLVLLYLVPASAARAWATGNDLCQAATAEAELSTGVPNQLLDAISRVESGRFDSEARGVRAWPWTINAQGQGHFYASKEEAVAAARAFQAAGVRSFDVGCMQINLMFHPDGFANLEAAFDPHTNAVFAAHFLTDLFHQTGSWPHAAAAYHSQTPNLGSDYQNKVLEAWAEPVDRPEEGGELHARAASTGHTPAPGNVMAASAEASSPSTNAMPRPLGGFGHIIREASSAPHGLLSSSSGRDLAAYRAMPVRVAFFPQRGMRD